MKILRKIFVLSILLILLSLNLVYGSDIERTFVFVKPDGVRKGVVGDIIRRFESRGIIIERLELLKPSRLLVEEHYKEHKNKPFFTRLVDDLSDQRIVAMVLSGPSVVNIVRRMVGPTDPREAFSGTIRGDFGLKVESNVVHSADSVDSAEREIHLWFTSENRFSKDEL